MMMMVMMMMMGERSVGRREVSWWRGKERRNDGVDRWKRACLGLR